MTVLVSSERFGDVVCEDSATLEFPRGLLGFEEQTTFVIVPADEDGVYSWLQSTIDPALAFLVTPPHFFFPDYEPEVNDADLLELDLRDPAETMLLCIVTIADDEVTANLLGPVVVNTRTRAARQVVLSETRWSTRTPLNGG